VVLVGGTTRIPQVKARLREYFGAGTNINDSIDPDVTVAYGAASIID
jgi:molecular chaperone DnaK (HSP70)